MGGGIPWAEEQRRVARARVVDGELTWEEAAEGIAEVRNGARHGAT